MLEKEMKLRKLSGLVKEEKKEERKKGRRSRGRERG